MTDRHCQLATCADELTASSCRPRRLATCVRHAGEWFDAQCTVWGFRGFGAVVAGLLVFSPLIDGGTTQLPVLIIRMVLLMSIVVWLLGRMKAGELFLPGTPLDACVALFAGWAMLSLVWSPYKNASLQWAISILFYAALFLIVTHGIRSKSQVSTHVFIVSGLGVMEGLLGVAQYLWLGEARARGTFFNPNFFAAYEAAVFALSLGILLFTPSRTFPISCDKWLWFVAAVTLAAVVTAQSRGASAALAATALCLGCLRYGKKALVIVSLCLLAVLVVPTPLQHRILHASAQDPYAYSRLDIWKSALLRLSDQPLGIGVGMFKQGSFQERFPIEGEIMRYRKRPESAHNEYLQIGVELGLAGLVLFLCGMGFVALEARQLLHESAERTDRALVIGLTGSLSVLLLHAAVDSTFHEPALVILLVLLGGLLHNLYVQARRESVTWRRIAMSYHPMRSAGVVAAGLVVAAVCVQPAAAWYAHEEGKRHAAQDSLEGALSWYVLASEIDPGTTGYHDSVARTAVQLYRKSGAWAWLRQAADEQAVARALNPVDGRFAFRSGTVYRMMASDALGNAQRAELLAKASDAYAEAIRLDPYTPFSYWELAQLHVADGHVEEAIALLKTAAAYEPNFLPGRALLAELSLQAGIPGDYAKELADIKAIRSRYEQQVRDDVERQFMSVDLYPLGRAVALGAPR